MKWKIEFIPHKQQRYDTLGDWQYDDKKLSIKISKTGDWKCDALLALHELIESLLCKSKAITDEDVDMWDFKFKGKGEPGDDRKCPYFYQHQMASVYEKLLAKDLGVDWEKYEQALEEIL